MPNIFACLCALQFPAQALLRLRPAIGQEAVAVLLGERPWERVCSYNRAAAALGVTAGISRAEAEIFPITLVQRSRMEEAAARSVLLTAASQFTPLIEDQSTDTECRLVLQIDGTGRLFGPPQALATALQNHLRQVGLTVRVAIAGNFHAALCLARANTNQAVLEVPHGTERSALARLPLSCLDLTSEHAETLASWGLKTLGELAELDVDEVVTRIGQSGRSVWQRARGEHPHHFVPIEVPFSLVESMEFDHPVDILESLLFAISPMLEQLVLRAEANTLALASLTLELTLEAAPVYKRTISPAVPTSNRTVLLKLLQLDLEAHPPPAAVLALSLTAEPGPTSKVQLGLFAPQMPEPMQLEVTLARIAALVGEGNVGSPRLSDTHQTDVFTMEKFVLPTAAEKANATPLPPGEGTLGLRRMRPPVPLKVTLVDDCPQQFFYNQRLYRVEQAFGPWQTSGNWWGPEPWSTRCWDVIARPSRPSSSLAEPNGDAALTGTISQSLFDHRWHLESLYD